MKKLILGLIMVSAGVGQAAGFVPDKLLRGILQNRNNESVTRYGGHDWRLKGSGLTYTQNYVELRGRIERERHVPGWRNGKASYLIRFYNQKGLKSIHVSTDGSAFREVHAELRLALGRCYGSTSCNQIRDYRPIHRRINAANVGTDWKRVLDKMLTHVGFQGQGWFPATVKDNLWKLNFMLFSKRDSVTRYYWGHKFSFLGNTLRFQKKVVGNEKTYEGYFFRGNQGARPIYFLVRYRGNQLQPVYVAYNVIRGQKQYQRLGQAADAYIFDAYNKVMDNRLSTFYRNRILNAPAGVFEAAAAERIVAFLAIGFRWVRD